MKLYCFPQANGIDTLELREAPAPRPERGQILVRMRAASLNYRDLNLAAGSPARGSLPPNLIPLSDGAGEVVETGPEVTRVKPGDRVAGMFMQSWLGGEIEPYHVDSSRGEHRDRLVGRREAVVRAPTPCKGALADVDDPAVFVTLNEVFAYEELQNARAGGSSDLCQLGKCPDAEGYVFVQQRPYDAASSGSPE